MKFLSLFSGIGCLDLGLERAGLSCVGQVEIDPFVSAVLDKHWPGLPRWKDVRDVTVSAVRERCGRIDGIVGGFMCTDVSVAGRGAGMAKATRSGLTWREMFRLIRGLKPSWLVIENVPALRGRGADRVIAVLERIGYACWATVVGAEYVGAPHRRNRVWIVGWMDDPHRERREETERGRARHDSQGERLRYAAGDGGAVVADAERTGWRTGSRESANETGSGQRRCEPAGNVQSACGVGLADATGERRERAEPARAASPGECLAEHGGEMRWPARPGQAQHGWEAPRLTLRSVGKSVDGTSERLVRAISDHFDCTPAEAEAWHTRNRFKVERFANRNALKALGNAVVWIIPYLIGLWIIEQASEPAEGLVTA